MPRNEVIFDHREKPCRKQILYTETLCNNTGISSGLINEEF